MFKKQAVVMVLAAAVIMVSGCATARKQKDLEMQGLRNQVSALETQLQSKDEEISGLKTELDRAVQEALSKETVAPQPGVKKVIPEVKSRPTVKQIQIALRNAGYSPGAIDGKMGRQTRDAVRAFQRENNLAVDGRVGKRTWNLLRKYLYQKVK